MKLLFYPNHKAMVTRPRTNKIPTSNLLRHGFNQASLLVDSANFSHDPFGGRVQKGSV